MEDKTWTREYAAQYAIDAHKGQYVLRKPLTFSLQDSQE